MRTQHNSAFFFSSMLRCSGLTSFFFLHHSERDHAHFLSPFVHVFLPLLLFFISHTFSVLPFAMETWYDVDLSAWDDIENFAPLHWRRWRRCCRQFFFLSFVRCILSLAQWSWNLFAKVEKMKLHLSTKQGKKPKQKEEKKNSEAEI